MENNVLPCVHIDTYRERDRHTHSLSWRACLCRAESTKLGLAGPSTGPGRVPEASRARGGERQAFGPGDHFGAVAVVTDQAVNLPTQDLESGPS